ncbi:MAG: hypothetical protein ACP5D7_07110 [Limnospira sp.]
MMKNGVYGWIGVLASVGIGVSELPARSQPPAILTGSNIISRYRHMVEQSSQPEPNKRMLLISAQNDLNSIVEDVGATCEALASGELTWQERQEIQKESLRQEASPDPQMREILRTDQTIRNSLIKQMCPEYIP